MHTLHIKVSELLHKADLIDYLNNGFGAVENNRYWDTDTQKELYDNLEIVSEKILTPLVTADGIKVKAMGVQYHSTDGTNFDLTLVMNFSSKRRLNAFHRLYKAI